VQVFGERRVFGVDLTQIPGVNVLTAQTLLAEVGPDLSRSSISEGGRAYCFLLPLLS
jgi:transposase